MEEQLLQVCSWLGSWKGPEGSEETKTHHVQQGLPGKPQPDPPRKLFPLEGSLGQLSQGPADARRPHGGASDLHTGILLQSLCSPCESKLQLVSPRLTEPCGGDSLWQDKTKLNNNNIIFLASHCRS